MGSGSVSLCLPAPRRRDRPRPVGAFAQRQADRQPRARTITHRLYELTLRAVSCSSATGWRGPRLLGTILEPRSSPSSGSALLWIYSVPRGLHALPQLDPARERARALRLRVHADGAPRLLGPRLRQQPPRRTDSRSPRNPYAAMPSAARLRLADRSASCSGARPRHWWAKALLDDLACLGLVRRDRDREPLLARLHRRDARGPCSRWASSTSGFRGRSGTCTAGSGLRAAASAG